MPAYVALLRGINVGGKNIIRMADLRRCFEGMGFEGVRSYIQSGNVIFGAEETDRAALAEHIEAELSRTFDYGGQVVLRSHGEMAAIVAGAPEGFGSDKDAYRYDVIFLKEPLAAAEAMESVSAREGVDEAHAGDGVLYFSRLISRASQSHLSRIVGTPIYQNITIRNWNTTTRILQMMDG